MRKLLYVVAGAAALASASAASSAVVVTSATNLTNPDPTTSIFTSGGITTIMFGQPNITGPTYDGAFTFTNDDAGMYKIVVGSSTPGFVWDLTKTLLTGNGSTYTFVASPTDAGQLSLTLGSVLLAGGNVPSTLSLSGTAPTGSILSGNVTISAAAVPEATTWAMMLLGFGAMGFAIRRRRRPVLAQLA
jgi:hypothetical protein